MSQPRRIPYQSRLAAFASVVLEILENDVEWNADTTDRIAREAITRKLADTDPEGLFRRDYAPPK